MAHVQTMIKEVEFSDFKTHVSDTSIYFTKKYIESFEPMFPLNKGIIYTATQKSYVKFWSE